MPTIVACPKCKTRYQLPDGVLGKPIKCKSCGTAFQTKATAPVGAPAVVASDKRIAPASLPAGRQSADKATNELARFGLDGPLNRQPDVFFGVTPLPRQSPDLLGNHASEPGFGEAETFKRTKPAVADEDKSKVHQAEFLTNPALRAETKKNRGSQGGKKQVIAPFYRQIWFIVSLGFPLLLALILLFTFFLPTAGGYLLSGYIVLALLSGLLIGLWNFSNCMNSADDTLELILFFLIPFYAIYFWIKHWSQVWQSTSANLAFSVVVWPASMIMFLLFVLIAGKAPVIPGFSSENDSIFDEVNVTRPIDYFNASSSHSRLNS